MGRTGRLRAQKVHLRQIPPSNYAARRSLMSLAHRDLFGAITDSGSGIHEQKTANTGLVQEYLPPLPSVDKSCGLQSILRNRWESYAHLIQEPDTAQWLQSTSPLHACAVRTIRRRALLPACCLPR